MNDMTQIQTDIKVVMLPGRSPGKANLLRMADVEDDLRQRAAKTNDWVFQAYKAEAVTESDNFTANGQVALAACDPFGVAVIWVSVANVLSVSGRGCAEACIYGAGDLFDRRIRRKERINAAIDVIKAAHRRAFSPLEQLGAALDDE